MGVRTPPTNQQNFSLNKYTCLALWDAACEALYKCSLV